MTNRISTTVEIDEDGEFLGFGFAVVGWGCVEQELESSWDGSDSGGDGETEGRALGKGSGGVKVQVAADCLEEADYEGCNVGV